MTKHTDEDFERAAREIASSPSHNGEVTNYQIAKHLERSPGGGLYKQLNGWRAGQPERRMPMKTDPSQGTVAMLGEVNDHIMSVARAIARDIAGQEVDDLRQLLGRIVAERDEAHEKIEQLMQQLAEISSRALALTRELADLRLSRTGRSAQIRLAAATLSAALPPRRSAMRVLPTAE